MIKHARCDICGDTIGIERIRCKKCCEEYGNAI